MKEFLPKGQWKYYVFALASIFPVILVPSQCVFKYLVLLTAFFVAAIPLAIAPRPAALVGAIVSSAIAPISLIGLPATEIVLFAGVAFVVMFLPLIETKHGFKGLRFLIVAAFVLMILGAILTRVHFVLASKSPVSNYMDGQILASLLFVVAFAVNPGYRKSILLGLCLSNTAMAVWCIFHAVLQGELLSDRLGFAGSINPNVLACFLDLTCGITLFSGLNQRMPRRYLYLTMGAIQYGSLILTQSRGSVFGVIVVGCVFLWRIRKYRATIISVVVLTPLILGLGAHRLFGRITSPSINDMASNYGRVMLLKSTWTILNRNQFVFGSGMDNFKKEKMSVGFPAWFDTEAMMSSHNAYLEFLLGWGLFGLLGWMLLLGGAIASGLRYSAVTLDPMGEGVALSLVSFGLHGMVESLVASPPFFLTLCVILGIAYALNSLVPPSWNKGSESIAN